MSARFDALHGQFDAFENHFSQALEGFESRLVWKLGAVMTVLTGLFVTFVIWVR